MSTRGEKAGCVHNGRIEIRSRDGRTLYGWHCTHCGKQWQRIACDDCRLVAELPANSSRTSWLCAACKRERREMQRRASR